MRKLRERLTYANVTATLALFLAIGGATAVAAGGLPKRSVGTQQLKPKAVKTGQLARNAVRTGKIGPEAVKAGKLAKNAVPTNRLRDGAVSGAKLANGAVGTGALANLAVGTGKLGNESVQTGKLGSGAITTGKLADDSVTGPKVKESTLGQVPSAAEADRVGGHEAACPAGMSAVSGLCFEVSSRAAAFQGVAFEDCADELRMLPSPAQLAIAAKAFGDVAAGNGEWTDSFYFADATNSAISVNNEGVEKALAITSELPYRCMVPLVR